MSDALKMSRSYDGVEPAVVDEAMLKQCVEEQGPSGEAGKVAKEEGILFKDVSSLCLDFKSENYLINEKFWYKLTVQFYDIKYCQIINYTQKEKEKQKRK